MQPTTPTVRRTLQIVEYSDGDTLVTIDTYTPHGDRRTSREIYRTSAVPAGLQLAANRYLLSEHLPALLAVTPDTTEAVTITRAAATPYALTFWRSLAGDTAANALGTQTNDDLTGLLELARHYLES